MLLNRDSLRQWANFMAIVSAFVTNVLANIAPIGGENIGEISNTTFKEVLITPANYAFAIWGLIYLGLISWSIYQVLPSQKQNPTLQKMGYFLVISSVAQIIWVLLFQLRFFLLALLAMLVILLSLSKLYLQIRPKKSLSQKQNWSIYIPVSLYFAWISVATLVNVATVLYYFNWNGWGISPQNWTIAMLLVGTILAALVGFRYRDRAFVGVFIWAFVAIALRHTETVAIAATAGGSAAFLLIISFLFPKVRLLR